MENNTENQKRILKLTKEHFKNSESYWSDYVGPEIPEGFDGSIEIEGNLGCVRFKSLCVEGIIITKTGTGIEASEGISAGKGISAGWGISVGEGISAGDGAGYGVGDGDG